MDWLLPLLPCCVSSMLWSTLRQRKKSRYYYLHLFFFLRACMCVCETVGEKAGQLMIYYSRYEEDELPS